MTTAKVEGFMTKSNRPYSANDVTSELKDANKSHVQKSLDKLVEKGVLRMKEYGKQKIYCAIQKEMDDDEAGADNDIDSQIQTAQNELNRLKQELTAAETKLKGLISSKPTEDVMAENKQLESNIQNMELRLLSFEKAENTLTAAEMNDISRKWDSAVKEYRKRKRIVTDILDQILEEYPKSKKHLFEEIGIEDDESVKMPKLM